MLVSACSGRYQENGFFLWGREVVQARVETGSTLMGLVPSHR